MVINALIYIVLTVLFSKIFGIPGLIYANMVNMAIRALWSLQISIENHNKMNKYQTSVKSILIKVLKSKIFLGLCVGGLFATFAAKKVLEGILIKLGKF